MMPLAGRLRAFANQKASAMVAQILREAADEIDRLETALGGAVTDMECSEHGPQVGWACPTCFALATGGEDVPRSKTFRSFPFRRWSA